MMMDGLINELHNVANQLMPVAGLVCLVLLAIALYRLIQFLKVLPVTLDGVNEVTASTNEAIKKLDGPLSTANSVAKTVDIVNNSAVQTASQVAAFALKNTESIVNAFKSKRGTADVTDSVDEEDFDVFQ